MPHEFCIRLTAKIRRLGYSRLAEILDPGMAQKIIGIVPELVIEKRETFLNLFFGKGSLG
jgi:hypothetical protein